MEEEHPTFRFCDCRSYPRLGFLPPQTVRVLTPCPELKVSPLPDAFEPPPLPFAFIEYIAWIPLFALLATTLALLASLLFRSCAYCLASSHPFLLLVDHPTVVFKFHQCLFWFVSFLHATPAPATEANLDTAHRKNIPQYTALPRKSHYHKNLTRSASTILLCLSQLFAARHILIYQSNKIKNQATTQPRNHARRCIGTFVPRANNRGKTDYHLKILNLYQNSNFWVNTFRAVDAFILENVIIFYFSSLSLFLTRVATEIRWEKRKFNPKCAVNIRHLPCLIFTKSTKRKMCICPSAKFFSGETLFQSFRLSILYKKSNLWQSLVDQIIFRSTGSSTLFFSLEDDSMSKKFIQKPINEFVPI